MNALKGRALVSGGAGLIGSHLADLLIAEGFQVTILDNLEPQTHPGGDPGWLSPKARFIRGDVRNPQDWARALEGVGYVFHQAAFGGFTSEVSQYSDVNVCGTARLFETIQTGNFPVKKIVVASSQAVYGEGSYECPEHGRQFPEKRPEAGLQKGIWDLGCPACAQWLRPALTEETKPCRGETPYALSKEFEERLALSLGWRLGIPVAALRYGVTYGPRQSVFNPYTGVVSIFSTQILNRVPPLVYEDGKQTRDFVYVGDVARANLAAMESPLAAGEVFNVGTGRATSIAELARKLSKLYGAAIEPRISGEFRQGDVRHVLLDPAKLRKTGFSAEMMTSLDAGLEKFSAWIRSQGSVQDYFSKAYEEMKRSGMVGASRGLSGGG